MHPGMHRPRQWRWQFRCFVSVNAIFDMVPDEYIRGEIRTRQEILRTRVTGEMVVAALSTKKGMTHV